MARFEELLSVLAYIQANLDGDLSLRALAEKGKLSPFHFHQKFRRALRETTKSYTLRLRLEHAASELLRSEASILEIALDSGFQSHEVFSRAFRRYFGVAPKEYRARGLLGDSKRNLLLTQHAEIARRVGPCVGLYRVSQDEPSPRRNTMTYVVTKKDLPAQPIFFIRRRVKAEEISQTLAEILPKVFEYIQRAGIPFGGPPFSRYLSFGPGLITLEAGMPVAQAAKGEGEIEAGSLHGGPTATTTHAGPYDKLSEAHAAVQRWIEAEKLEVSGAPWELYVTDPAQHPDPREWRTEVFWPLKA